MPADPSPSPPQEPGPDLRWTRLRCTARKIGVALGVLLALYGVFETGRYVAGYSIVSALHERTRLRSDIARLKASNRALRAHVIRLDTLDAGHRHEVEVVTQTISDLQARISRQALKLAFYRNIVARGTPPIGLRIGEVRLSSGKRPLHYVVNISLLRADRPDGSVSGTVKLSIDGQGPDGTTLSDRVLTGQRSDLAYRFRYYQEIQEHVVLPPGFKPARLTVTVQSHRQDIAPLTQTYPWSAISSP